MPPPAPSPLEKRELPLPPPPHSQGHDNGESMMDFEYSPAPVVFEDWESLTGAVIEQPGQQNGPPADWGMVQYFNDPRVTS